MEEQVAPHDTPRRGVAALERRATVLIRALRARNGAAVRIEPLHLRSSAGYQLDAHVHVPENRDGPLPAVVLCPGIDDTGMSFDTWGPPLRADEVARLGYIALHFDPAGRGRSWGAEDMGGPEHADEVACAVRYLAARPDVDAARIGIVAISLGVAMAVGAVAHHGAPVAWLLDWEGPCDREIITAGGTMMAPALEHELHDNVYWHPREAVRHVGAMGCGYVRLQAEVDHAQPTEKRHAQRMLAAARDGDIPWFQLNDHPRGEIPEHPRWLPPGKLAANRALLDKLRTLREERRP